jgi:hypothetical protein
MLYLSRGTRCLPDGHVRTRAFRAGLDSDQYGRGEGAGGGNGAVDGQRQRHRLRIAAIVVARAEPIKAVPVTMEGRCTGCACG